MLASAKFVLPEINKSFGVPVSSVLSDNGQKFVFVINNKKLQKRQINVNRMLKLCLVRFYIFRTLLTIEL